MEKQSTPVRIGVDTGGTFTDVIMSADGAIYTHKLLSTPENPALAVLQGIREILSANGFDPEKTRVEIVHGSTVATNTLLERNGAKVALVTTAGFEDILEIGRQARPSLYDFFVERPEPLVPSAQRIGVRERILYTGEVETPMDLAQLDEIRLRLQSQQIDAIAICFLFAYVNPMHEQIAAKHLASLDLPISCSHQILPEYREYERFSTTVANAYVQPRLGRYIQTLESGVNGALRLMQSNGGGVSAQTARSEPVRTALSGPAGGVIGAFEVAKIAGREKIISFDMGGTSTDVSLCNGKITMTTEGVIGGTPIKTPMIDIHTVGAGGGSIAEIDVGGALRVGPRSAGADPGPICYGKGDALTVTDANLFLGRLDPERFLGGKMQLDAERVTAHMEVFAKRLNLVPVQAAEGILKVANATMEKAIRVISVERGFDTRDFTLVSFGGAGGLHACDLARSLAIPTVLIPPNGGLLSAYGMLLSDAVKDYSQTVLWKVDASDHRMKKTLKERFGALVAQAETEMQSGHQMKRALKERFGALVAQAEAEMQAEGFAPDQLTIEQTLDMRYEGQSYELNTSFSPEFVSDFHLAHQQRFGYARRDARVEIVNLRLRVIGPTPRPEFKPEELAEPDPTRALIDRKPVVFNGEATETAFYQREKLKPGNHIFGPAVIVEFSATTVVPPDFWATVDAYRNLVLERFSPLPRGS
jgi:N-methylhydantoinase A